MANRLHEALLAEALRLVAEGVASPHDVDDIVTTTFGPRFAVSGPLAIIDQAGLEVQRRAFENLDRLLDSPVFRPPPVLDDLIARGRTGLRAGRGIHDYSAPADVVLAERAERLVAVMAAAGTTSTERTPQ